MNTIESSWHQLASEDVIRQLESDSLTGLSDDAAQLRLEKHGPNELVQQEGRGIGQILWEQFSGAMVIMLLVAAIVSFALGEATDAVVIFAIIALNAALGFFQDYRAEKALAALKEMAVPKVRVRRDGSVKEISSIELVPGDVVLLEVGNYVPADGRLVESINLKIQEAALTGESEAVEKQVRLLAQPNSALGDRTNMVYMGTIVTYGHGQAVITETGMDTQLGHIARSLQTVKPEPTPLQKRLAQLGRSLAIVAIAVVLLVFVMGIARGVSPRLMLMTSLSLAVAIVPEGLPAVATVTLAIGAGRMFKRNALIRRLPAVETLGSVTVICSDKTGTLTENRMKVTALDVANLTLDLTDSSQRDEDRFEAPDDRIDALSRQVAEHTGLTMLLSGAALCNDADLEIDGDRLRGIGEPTENALAIVAARLGFHKDRLVTFLPRESEIPFDSERKRMTTVHRITSARADIPETLHDVLDLAGDQIAFTKGAVDSILPVCHFYWSDDEPKPIDPSWRERIERANNDLASQGMRVLGVAFRLLDESPSECDESVEDELIFLGLLGMIDPPRAEVADAVARCKSAGIRPVMITGDHPLTATSIAKQLSISNNGQVLTGQDLDGLDDEEFHARAETTSVYARVAPKHKLKLVRAFEENGHVVAMTGDGVNDAPALKQAHIGVAMGITGTDVSKEASQMVLLDDNFSTIVGAIEEGRIVYDNIRKFVKYTMTSNTGEIWVMILGPLVGMPIPLLPLQILWINLVTDGLPGLALALEKAERNTMQRPPVPPKQHIFDRKMIVDIAWIGLLMGIVSLSLGYWSWKVETSEEAHWRTIIFTVLTLSQLGNAMAIRSSHDSLFRIGVFSNPALAGAVAVTLGLQMAVIFWPPLQTIFHTTALGAKELMICLALSLVVFAAVELVKRFSGSQNNEPAVTDFKANSQA